jgi:hypothetical protein
LLGNNSEESTEGLGKTTLKVYRFLYKNGKPLSVREIQHGLALSSSSVADYHVKKLLTLGLIVETNDSKFFVDRRLFDNMLRIKRTLVPVQIAYSLFFGTCLLVLLLLFRPNSLRADYVFPVIVIAVACGIFAYQTYKVMVKNQPT